MVEVADAGGISPAARRLRVSRSIVSRRRLRLEAQLGGQRLARTTRGAALTKASALFRGCACRLALLRRPLGSGFADSDLRGRRTCDVTRRT
ncbi:LysR family transcriptional regulator [Inquilinus sp. YAF38]|uniref:helix-turn-helix domain-containing protein n=1 Tax=Inquilinus sp. YAF38 TaxID=3233084 RepID=UPI003F93949C